MSVFILQLVELALSMAQSQLNGSELEQTLVRIIQKGATVYYAQTGKTLDPKLITPLNPL